MSKYKAIWDAALPQGGLEVLIFEGNDKNACV